MKKILILLFLSFNLLMPCYAYESAKRTGMIDIAGIPSEYDTLVHRHIGPGTTYTCYQFNNLIFGNNFLSYKLRAHIIQVDITNPYQSFHPYIDTEDYFRAYNQVQIVAKERQAGRKAFASCAGFIFQQVSTADGLKKANELDKKYVINKQVCYADSRTSYNYYLDDVNTAHLGTVKFVGTVTTASEEVPVSVVNHCRDYADSIQSATLFCNGMASWAMDNASGKDYVLKVVSNDGRIEVGNNTCELREVLSGCGHKPESNECIISAVGDIESRLNSMQIGETITIDLNFKSVTDNLLSVEQLNNVCNEQAIENGIVNLFNKKYTAFICVGISEDGKTVFLADNEISSYSNAPADALAYLLKEIGAQNAFWMDGGPSAEMTVDGEWVTVNSIGGGFNGRFIPGAQLIYSVAPDDDVITHVEISDPAAKTLYIGEEYAVDVFGYNQYGEMINPHAQQTNQVKVWCDETIGYVDQGNFFAGTEGNGYIYIQVEGQQEIKQVPITVKSNRSLNISPDKLFTGEGRACQLKLFLEDEAGRQEVPAAEAVWHTTSKYVVSSCSDGLIIPYVDGYAEVIADYNGLSDTIGVTVENLEEVVDQLDLSAKAIEMYDKGFLDLQLPGVPHGFGLTVSGTPGCEVVVSYELGNGEIMEEERSISISGYESFTIVLDYNAVDTYPVVIKSILADEGSCHIENLTAYYQEISHIDDVSVITSTHYYNMWGQKVSVPGKGMFIKNRKKIVYTPM